MSRLQNLAGLKLVAVDLRASHPQALPNPARNAATGHAPSGESAFLTHQTNGKQ
jgi:hypothetical protein